MSTWRVTRLRAPPLRNRSLCCSRSTVVHCLAQTRCSGDHHWKDAHVAVVRARYLAQSPHSSRLETGILMALDRPANPVVVFSRAVLAHVGPDEQWTAGKLA